MRLPRDVSGADLIRVLRVLGYELTRQTGGHARLTTQQRGEHHVTVPLHDALRIGTLADLLSDVETHFGLTREELLRQLSL